MAPEFHTKKESQRRRIEGVIDDKEVGNLKFLQRQETHTHIEWAMLCIVFFVWIWIVLLRLSAVLKDTRFCVMSRTGSFFPWNNSKSSFWFVFFSPPTIFCLLSILFFKTEIPVRELLPRLTQDVYSSEMFLAESKFPTIRRWRKTGQRAEGEKEWNMMGQLQ